MLISISKLLKKRERAKNYYFYFCSMQSLLSREIMGIKRILQNRQLSNVSPYKYEGRWRPGENPLKLVGLILYLEDFTELALLQKVQTFFLGKGVAFRTCIFQKNEKMEIPEEFICHEVLMLNQQSVNWYGLLRPGHAEAFLHESFDLVINLSKKYFFTTTYLASLAKATLKVGREMWPLSPYHVVLGSMQSDDEDAFIHLLDNSLQFIRFE